MRINRTGITRIVFLTNRYAVKIPNFTYRWSHFLSGLLSNMQEGDTYKNSIYHHKGNGQHLLCPVIWYSWGGWILIMKRVDRVLDWDEDDKYDISEHRKFYPGDDKVKNYGILDNKVVKIDYGSLD